MKLNEVKAELLKDRRVRKAYDALEPEFELVRELISARARARLTQRQVAARMGTTQSVVARIESGRITPSFKTLARYARATGMRPVIKLVAAD
ncbi:MAG: helix-turn-helix transcriptional regulator [Candidatus Binataceae bacterium]|jgi:predicted transcriptional regulator